METVKNCFDQLIKIKQLSPSISTATSTTAQSSQDKLSAVCSPLHRSRSKCMNDHQKINILPQKNNSSPKRYNQNLYYQEKNRISNISQELPSNDSRKKWSNKQQQTKEDEKRAFLGQILQNKWSDYFFDEDDEEDSMYDKRGFKQQGHQMNIQLMETKNISKKQQNYTHYRCNSEYDQSSSLHEYDLSEDEQEYSEYRSNEKKKRKTRTTITIDKIVSLNKAFQERQEQIEAGKPQIYLKELSKEFNLGYSTILHKYRQFRGQGKVKGGALIDSLQKKRKYTKSLIIQKVIEECLSEKAFYSAVEICNFIEQKYGKQFSRSIINRHLIQMGYSLKSLTRAPIKTNNPQVSQIRKIYTKMLTTIMEDPRNVVLYIDEIICKTSMFRKFTNKNQQPVYMMIAATKDGVTKHTMSRIQFERKDFADFIESCILQLIIQIKKMDRYIDKIILVTDMKSIHYDQLSGKDENQVIKPIISKYNISRVYLPPYSPDLNPLESLSTYLKNKIKKNIVEGSENIKILIQEQMKIIVKEPVQAYFKAVNSALEFIRLECSSKLDNERKIAVSRQKQVIVPIYD